LSFTKYNVAATIREGQSRSSFHVASEEHVRVEFRNFVSGGAMDRFAYDGNVIATCFGGRFAVDCGGDTVELTEHDQAVLEPRISVHVRCLETGTLQLVWAPGHAATTTG
jgi:hypothetical protein